MDPAQTIPLVFKPKFTLGSGVVTNYDTLTNKPRINGVELSGDKTSETLKLQSRMTAIVNSDIDTIIYGGEDA